MTSVESAAAAAAVVDDAGTAIAVTVVGVPNFADPTEAENTSSWQRHDGDGVKV